ncbi:MAG: hypothetical protein BMS9Abin29_0245 [Gemmatimonadota bacterium]|nr:MAG: hypothetical protein BMS9Abin29_0245 [Gemmatimonadota bacterium]
MQRTLLTFFMAVLFPVILGIAVSVLFLEQAQAGLRNRSDLRMSRAGSYFLARELEAAKDSLAPRAEVSSIPSPPTPAVLRALAGDTVMAIAEAEDGLRVTVLLSDSGVVRGAATRLSDDFVEAFQSVTNYGLSVYFGGNRVLSQQPHMGPTALPDEVLAELGRGVESVATSVESGTAIVTRFGGEIGAADGLVLVVGQTESRGLEASLAPLLAVLAMILLLSLAAAWSVQSRASERGVGHRPPLMQSVLVAFIPVLAGVALLTSLDNGFGNTAGQAVRGDLARASALLRVSGEGSSMEAARSLGFDAELIDRGVVLASTIEDPESRNRLAAIRPPPPTFSSTGSIELAGVEHSYMATRARRGSVMVLLARGPEAQAGEVRFRLIAAGLLMAIPPLLYLGLLVFAANKPTALSSE